MYCDYHAISSGDPLRELTIIAKKLTYFCIALHQFWSKVLQELLLIIYRIENFSSLY